MKLKNDLRVLSDIHLEFGPLDLPVMHGENKQILIIAGDMGLADHPFTFIPALHEWSMRFQDIIYVPGNHEYYGTSILRGIPKIKEAIQNEDLANVHVLNNEVIRINEVSFVCSTMWASYNKQSPNTMYQAQLWMNDHIKIRTGPLHKPYERAFKPQDAYEEFLKAINFIFPTIKKEKYISKHVVVVTHHAPSYQSLSTKHKSDDLSGAYASELGEEILDADPDVWIHGHIHESVGYEIGATAILSNPRGYYPDALNPNFNPKFLIELKEQE